MAVIAYIAMGSNLNAPIEQLNSAIKALNALPHSSVVQVSSFYQNPAHGPPQPDFINAVAKICTDVAVNDLLLSLQSIEHLHGRARTAGIRNEPRTLDLDIVLFGQQVIAQPELTIPHPRMLERPFVLVPLLEIEPDLILPDGHFLHKYIKPADHLHLLRLPLTSYT